jgi:HlyD family secretion protein
MAMSLGKGLGWVVVLAALGAAGWFGYQKWDAKDEAPKFRTAKVEKGPLIATVAATGILNPVVSVSVSSQVSGQVKELFVDFNAEVKKGQLIARIDPEQIEYRLRQAQADLDAARASIGTQQANIAVQRAELARAEANLAEAKRDFDRKASLVQKNFISPSEAEKAEAVYKAQAAGLEAVRAQLGVAQANAKNSEAVVKQREAQLAQAKVDLERTAIRSPVDGVVVKRAVEPGQTVAASLQAPELFVIAQNLADMQVDAAIDESDVGRLRVGQAATFTVDAFAGRTFNGAIRQVRKAAQTVSNVVTYTVVISASNPDLILLPGMTASVRITTDRRDSALKVANSALRFRPPGTNEDAQGGAAGGGAAPGGGTGAGAGGAVGGGGGGVGPGGPGGGRGQLGALRERLVAELKLDASQQTSLDAIFAGMREKFMALRDLPEADRAKAAERNRAEIREKITAILNETQRKRYAEIVAETAGRAPARGRVWIAAADGKPQAVSVRLGLTDGTTTELLGSDLKEGQEVLVGVQLPPGKAPSAPAGAPRGPRLPF